MDLSVFAKILACGLVWFCQKLCVNLKNGGKIAAIRCVHNVPGVCVASTLSDVDLAYLHA